MMWIDSASRRSSSDTLTPPPRYGSARPSAPSGRRPGAAGAARDLVRAGSDLIEHRRGHPLGVRDELLVADGERLDAVRGEPVAPGLVLLRELLGEVGDGARVIDSLARVSHD